MAWQTVDGLSCKRAIISVARRIFSAVEGQLHELIHSRNVCGWGVGVARSLQINVRCQPNER